jgi:hypothetical protein
VATVSTFGVAFFKDQQGCLHKYRSSNYLHDAKPTGLNEEMVAVLTGKDKNQLEPYNLLSSSLHSV